MQMHPKMATIAFFSTFVVMMLGSVVAVTPAPVSMTSGNLLVNPGAESGMTGWTTTLGAPRSVAYGALADMTSTKPGPSSRGLKFFSGGPNSASSFYQVVKVSSYATQIAANKLHARLTGYLGGYAQDDDAVSMTMTFQGSTGQTIGCKYTLGPLNQWDRDQRTMTVFRDSWWHSVPVGTVSIRVTYSCRRVKGTECDGYADNLSLTVRATTVVTADHMDCPAKTYSGNCTSGYLLNTALPSPSPQLSVAQINSLLKAHNDKRRAVTPGAQTMPMLTWDQTLANYAYKYISTCPGVQHSSNTARTNPNAYNYGYLGENLAAGSDTTKYGINGGANAVAMWNAQSAGFTYVGPPTCKITDLHVCGKCSISDCGHYTQVVWGNSKTVGCAYAYCPNNVYKNFWICAYGPGGNYMGQPPYVSAKPKDACQLYGTLEEEFHVQGNQRQLLSVNDSASESFESLESFEEVNHGLVQLPRSTRRNRDADSEESTLDFSTANWTVISLGSVAAVGMLAVAAVVYSRVRQQAPPRVKSVDGAIPTVDTLPVAPATENDFLIAKVAVASHPQSDEGTHML